MAAGRVITGFSKPFVAKLTSTSSSGTTTYSYTGGMALARGVDVNVTPNTPDNNFYADNALAETANYFSNGTFSLTVDGLFKEARDFIQGLTAPAASATDKWTYDDDDTEHNYFGFGFVIEYQSEGVKSYVPIVILKAAFDYIPDVAATREQDIKFQTQSIGGKFYRRDDDKHPWRAIGEDCTTEAAAVTALKAKLNIAA